MAIKGDHIAALRLARRALQRMVVRGLDYLPPADVTFAEFGTAMLKADQFANSDDEYDFRKIVESTLKAHFILNDTDVNLAYQQSSTPWPHRPAGWPALTVGDAYAFLDKNRKRLALSTFRDYRDFVVRSVNRTAAPKERIQNRDQSGKDETVVIVYEYPVDVELKGVNFGRYEGRWITVHGGGTLVFDAVGNLRHHARKAVTRDRINQILAFLKTGLGSGAIRPITDSLDDELRQGSIDGAWLLKMTSDRAVLRSNAAARCKFSHGNEEAQ
jgi:hypothetical protein